MSFTFWLLLMRYSWAVWTQTVFATQILMSGVDREDKAASCQELNLDGDSPFGACQPSGRRTKPGELIPVYLCCICGARQAVHLKEILCTISWEDGNFPHSFEEELMWVSITSHPEPGDGIVVIRMPSRGRSHWTFGISSCMSLWGGHPGFSWAPKITADSNCCCEI